jgi:hypothetical protein
MHIAGCMKIGATPGPPFPRHRRLEDPLGDLARTNDSRLERQGSSRGYIIKDYAFCVSSDTFHFTKLEMNDNFHFTKLEMNDICLLCSCLGAAILVLSVALKIILCIKRNHRLRDVERCCPHPSGPVARDIKYRRNAHVYATHPRSPVTLICRVVPQCL